jgi:hypothetical protein
LEQTAGNNNRTRHTEVAGLLHDKKFDCVTEDIVREKNIKDVFLFLEHSHSKKAINVIIFGPDTARFSLRSVSAGNLMPGSVSRSFSGKYKTLKFLSVETI